MSIKINIDIALTNGHAHCNLEVPLNAIGATSPQDQQRIVDFTAIAVAAILREAQGPPPPVAVPAAAAGAVAPANNGPGDATAINVFVRDTLNGREIVFNIERRQPLQRALVAYANHYGTTVYNHRLRTGDRLVAREDTAESGKVGAAGWSMAGSGAHGAFPLVTFKKRPGYAARW